MDYGATRSDNEPPSEEEVREALKDAAKKLHKSAGTDGVCNWMLVWGGETVVKGLQTLFEAAWEAKHLPEAWRVRPRCPRALGPRALVERPPSRLPRDFQDSAHFG